MYNDGAPRYGYDTRGRTLHKKRVNDTYFGQALKVEYINTLGI